MDLFGYYVNILAVVFSAMSMFLEIIGSRHRRQLSRRHADVEDVSLDQHSRSPRQVSSEKHNGSLTSGSCSCRDRLCGHRVCRAFRRREALRRYVAVPDGFDTLYG